MQKSKSTLHVYYFLFLFLSVLPVPPTTSICPLFRIVFFFDTAGAGAAAAARCSIFCVNVSSCVYSTRLHPTFKALNEGYPFSFTNGVYSVYIR